jgi:hypothetical protein
MCAIQHREEPKEGRPMAMNYSDYPGNWEEIRAEVLKRAKNADGVSQCECVGECGREHKGIRCHHLQYGLLTTKSKYRVILTTAHLCHTPKCDRFDHLKSMCQPCHQIFDLRERQKRVGGKIGVHKSSATQLSKLAKPGGGLPKMRQVQPSSATKLMTIPDFQTLLLPVLHVLADGVDHSSQEIRDRVRVQFDIAPHELLVRNRKGKTVFHSNVDLALANLQGAPHRRTKAIEKVRKGVYKITEYGKAILSRNPSDLNIKDL